MSLDVPKLCAGVYSEGQTRHEGLYDNMPELQVCPGLFSMSSSPTAAGTKGCGYGMC